MATCSICKGTGRHCTCFQYTKPHNLPNGNPCPMITCTK